MPYLILIYDSCSLDWNIDFALVKYDLIFFASIVIHRDEFKDPFNWTQIDGALKKWLWEV